MVKQKIEAKKQQHQSARKRIDLSHRELNECLICLDPLKSDIYKSGDLQSANSKFALKCSHDQYHKKCITSWLEKNAQCPICYVDASRIMSDIDYNTSIDMWVE